MDNLKFICKSANVEINHWDEVVVTAKQVDFMRDDGARLTTEEEALKKASIDALKQALVDRTQSDFAAAVIDTHLDRKEAAITRRREVGAVRSSIDLLMSQKANLKQERDALIKEVNALKLEKSGVQNG